MKDGDLDRIAGELAGNWLDFHSFGLDDGFCEAMVPAGDWCIVYTSNRDSGLLEQSNESVIMGAMAPFMGDITDPDEPADCESATHGHWAVGHVDGLYLRVRRDGTITPAFAAYADLVARLEDYGCLDEEDWSSRQWASTQENVAHVIWEARQKGEDTPAYTAALPGEVTAAVSAWLEDHDPRELEDRDGQGGYPSTESVVRALVDLGYLIIEDEDA